MKELVDALRVLALPGEQQLASQPDGTAKADELALDFDDALRLWKPRIWKDLSDEKKAALEAIDAALDEMSDERNSELWSNDAVRHNPRWQDVRTKARAALALFAG